MPRGRTMTNRVPAMRMPVIQTDGCIELSVSRCPTAMSAAVATGRCEAVEHQHHDQRREHGYDNTNERTRIDKPVAYPCVCRHSESDPNFPTQRPGDKRDR